MTTLIIGGTGRVGSATADVLRAQGETVRILSHSQEKLDALPADIERAFADLDDPSSLPAAFKGVRAVLLSLAVSPTEEARGFAALDAAAAAGVEKIVHISVKQYPGSESRVFYQSKRAIEAKLKDSGFNWTVLQAANFFQADSTLKAYIIDQGLYTPPIGGVGVDKMDSRDVGYAAAKALTTETYNGQTADLYGPATFTGESSAANFARAVGKPVKYMGDDIAKWAAMNSPRLGPWYISALSGLYEQQQKYGMIRPKDEPQHPLLPTTLRTFEDYADEMAKAWLA